MASKKELLRETVEHIDITSFDSTKIIESMGKMSFTSRDLARAAKIYNMMLEEKDCAIMLTLAGSTSAGGCMQIYHDLVKNNMVDAIVATGASIVDMDFFEALGFKHYIGTPAVDDNQLRKLYIDRIYDTFIDEEELQNCDKAICKIADSLPPRPYSSREFIKEMGKWLTQHSKKKMSAPTSGLLMTGGGVPKNFAQDTVVCAEILGKEVPMHKYAIQITVADVRDGACSSSTLKEASSWGKVDTTYEQMVYAEATSVLPLLASYAYHKGSWKGRKRHEYAKMF